MIKPQKGTKQIFQGSFLIFSFVLFVPFCGYASDYKNPVIFGDYSDPDVIRVGDDFYLTASSFNCIPGLPILHSKDLVNWKIIGHALKRQPPLDVFARPQHGGGVWAPAIRFHNNEFYIFYGDPDYGIYMVKTRDPRGSWSEPLLIRSAKGWIDPCPFWDDDGNSYLVHAWANSRSGIKSILTINRMSADGTKLLDEGTTAFDGRVNHPTIEGPKLYKRNGYYYIFAPAGGWQTVLRARNIYGPYEDRIVMDRGKTDVNGPHPGGWVELKSGESWFIHFQDRDPYGRIVHLQPLAWRNDWPVIGVDKDGDGKGEPVSRYRKPNVGREYPIEKIETSDEFSGSDLGLQWQWHANAGDDWLSLSARPGWLRLPSVPVPNGAYNLWAVPNLLLQKLPARKFTVTTSIDPANLLEGERSGLLMMGRSYSYLAVARTEEGLRLVRVTTIEAPTGSREFTAARVELKSATVQLRVEVGEKATCRFSYSTDGRKFVEFGEKFVASPGMGIGAKVGLFSVAPFDMPTRGYADYEWFRVLATD